MAASASAHYSVAGQAAAFVYAFDAEVAELRTLTPARTGAESGPGLDGTTTVPGHTTAATSSTITASAELRIRLGALEKRVTDAALFLPQYDLRRCLQILADLNSKLVEETGKSRPKFAFASKGKKPAASSTTASTKVSPLTLVSNSTVSPPNARAEPLFSPPATATVFEGKSNEYFAPTRADLLSSPDVNGSPAEVYLLNLRSCVVDLRAISPVGAIHIKNVHMCILLCGGIMGSLLGDGIVDSIVVAACRQFRMHTSKNARILLHASSHPIIEECYGLVFEPYTPASLVEENPSPLSWVNLIETADLGLEEGCGGRWAKVEDFNWLKKAASPHWVARLGLPPVQLSGDLAFCLQANPLK